jgi:hypothetical protein
MEIAKLEEGDIRGIVDEGDLKGAAKVWDKIRPYITVMGNAFSNPLHYFSFAPWKVKSRGDLENNRYNAAEVMALATSEKKVADGEEPVAAAAMPLALYEYIVKNGTEGIIGDIESEWALHKRNSMRMYGIYSGCSYKMTGEKDYQDLQAPLKIRQDFFKFQKSMIKELY